MVLAVDASSPAYNASGFLGSTPETWASNSFSPPAGSVIVAVSWAGDSFENDWTTGFPTITDSLGSHLTWTLAASAFSNAETVRSERVAVFWAYTAAAPGSMTVSFTESASGGQYIYGMIASVVVFTGASTSAPIAAGSLISGVTAASTSVSETITPTTLGSALLIAAGNAVSSGVTNTAGASCYLTTNYGGTGNAVVAGLAWLGTSGGPVLTSSMTGQALGLSNTDSSPWSYVGFEVVPGSVPTVPALPNSPMNQRVAIVPGRRGWMGANHSR